MKMVPSKGEANRSEPNNRNISISLTDRVNVEFAANYITKLLEDFFIKNHIPVVKEEGYHILKIETTEWEIEQ